MDVERGIRVAVDTGDVTLGSEKSIQSLKLGKGLLAVVAANSPKSILEDVEYYANLSNIPYIVYEGTSVELGSVCGKPFTVATLIVNDPGDSTILEVVGQIFVSIKFNANEIRYIALFESMTGAMVKDCIIDDELSKVTFVVKNGDMGLAIGKGGSTVTKVKRAVDKGVEIIEYNEDPAQFIRNILSPAELKSIKVIQKEGQDKIAIVNADSSNKRIAIGKNGVNIERAKLLAKRQHDISNIILK